MGKRVISKLRPILMSLLIVAAVTFTVLGITTAIISDTATVKAESVEHTHDGYTEWTDANALPNAAGSYYLTTDVTISSTWSVPSGTTKLCLNGHGIKMTGNNSVVTVKAGATLKLYDCDTTTEHKYSVSNAKSNGAGLAIVNDALTSGYQTFKGGYITGGRGAPVNSWSRGGAFYIEGTVEMYGGTVIGNGRYDNTHGGGFNTQGSGTFKMYGGSIQNNAGKCGGATRLQGTDGSCEIYGGKIINNIVSADGGAIHVGGSIPVILQNCEISGNYANSGPGAGIWMTTTGTEISGRTIITNNLTNSGQSNVEIGNGYVISVGELTEGASVGIKINNDGTGTFTSGWSDNMEDADPADYFTSDNASYEIRLSGEEVYVGSHAHVWTYSADGNVITATCTGAGKGLCDVDAQTLTITAEDKVYDGGSVVASVEKSENWTVYGLAEPSEIVYSGNTDAWIYVASVTVGGATASVEFTVSETLHGHKDIFFVEWTSTNGLPTTAGNYYLTDDVTISSTWFVPTGTTNLCLNGHGIRMTGNDSVIKVGEGSTLKLYDCDTTTEHRFTVNDATPNGAGLAVVNDALTGSEGTDYLTFNGGYITGGNANPYGGGVRIGLRGKFEMFGGTIIGNNATSHGGGVCVSGAGVGESSTQNFIMHGGKICYNKANWGGGIAIYGQTYITGNVAISNNVANSGGAGIELEGNGRLYMNCGIITDNVMLAQNGGMWKGGGVHVPSGSEFHISGDLQIKDNYQADGETNSNLFIRSGLSLTIDSALDQDAFICVGLQDGTGTFTSGWSTYMDGKDPADYFTSDNGDYIIGLSDGEAKVAEPSLFEGNGTEESPYLIQSADDWNALAEHINGGGTKYSGKHFKLTSDISITTGLGYRPGNVDYQDYVFSGVFDGDGHTIDCAIDNNGFAAPFAIVHNATIKNLKVTGTVHSSANHASGLVSASKAGNLTDESTLVIQNVLVSASVSCASHVAGIVGHAHKNTITMDNVVFDGNISASSVQGGFIGWGGANAPFNATLKDCVFAGTYREGVAFYPIAYAAGQGNVTLDNDFYSTATWSGGSPITPTGSGKLVFVMATVEKDDAVQYYGSFADAVTNWTDGSTLKLNADVTTNDVITVNGDVTKTIDLNGHGIKKTGTGRVFTVFNGATFNITDGNPQIEHKFTVSNGLATVNDDLQSGYQTFTGGYITGGNAKGGDENGWGGCLVVSLSGKRATLNMSGGTIIGNRCDMSGAAIRVGGDKNDYTVFNMTGGAIMYNTAGHGGAITWEPNVIVKISGGVINDNFVGSNEVNVYLEDGQIITVDTAFTAAASIGVKLQNGQGVFTSGWSTYMNAADPYDYFTSDNASYEVRLSDNEAYVGTHVHVWTYSADGNVITATCAGVEKGTCNISDQTLTITADGKTYDGTAVVATLSFSDGWTTVNGLEIPSIYYSDGVNAATTTAPVSVGTYTASITFGEKTATVEFEITRKTETKIDDKTEDEQNAVSVVGLDLELANIENKNPDANSISLVMTVEAKTEETAVKAASIIETAKNKSLEFFEIKIEKTIDSITTVLDTTSNVLEIAVPYEKINKRGLVVYSYHGDSVRTFAESDTKEDGTFRVDKENRLVYVYANKFSTYAIGYTPYYRVQTSFSLGSYTGKANVTLESDADANITFTLDNTDAGDIVFPDVPKGQYTLTIVWEDGITNTLKMKLTVGPQTVLSAITEQDAESEASEEQSEEQESQTYYAYSGPTNVSEILTEDAEIESVVLAESSVIGKAQETNREISFIPRRREYIIKRERLL